MLYGWIVPLWTKDERLDNNAPGKLYSCRARSVEAAAKVLLNRASEDFEQWADQNYYEISREQVRMHLVQLKFHFDNPAALIQKTR